MTNNQTILLELFCLTDEVKLPTSTSQAKLHVVRTLCINAQLQVQNLAETQDSIKSNLLGFPWTPVIVS